MTLGQYESHLYDLYLRAIFVGIDRQKVIKVNGVDTRSWCLHILAHFIESIISMIAISFFPIVIAGGFQISMLHRHNFFIVLLICGTFPISQVVVGWAFLQTFNGSDFITEAGTESYFLSLTLLLLTATDFTTPQVAVSVSSQIISKLVPRIIERLELEEKMSKNEAQPAEDLSNHWESTSWNLMRSRDGKVVPVMDMEDKRSNTLEDSSSCQEVKIDCVRHSDTEIDPHPRVLISVTEGDTSFISHNLSKSDDAQSRLFTPTSQHFVQSNNSRLSLTSNPFSTTSTLQRPQMRPATVSSSMYRPRASQFHRAVEATVHVLVKMTDMELAVVLELGILMVEAYHGLETYNSNQYPWVHAIAFSFASAMHAFWIVSASKKLFSYGAFGPTKPWPWQDL
ncbi:hypothetical protein BC829DRAFT_431907 [Chytridium lagenaria]|nr:hypothetical protein BC829DRAFT_431907 [Chytridium lagenaria]